jgi:hypothetical protein
VPKNSETVTLDPEKATEFIKGILGPVSEQIAECRDDTNGIVFVLHRPGKLAKAMMKKLGVKLIGAKTTVFGLTCDHATKAFGHDLVTKRWCQTEPNDDQIKVFLSVRDGTALLTVQTLSRLFQATPSASDRSSWVFN